MEASVARCLRTPPEGATPQGLIPSLGAALRGDGHRSIVVIRNYRFSPITVVQCRVKEPPLRPRRSYFAPAEGLAHKVARKALGGGAGYRPRVRMVYYAVRLSP
ncbi:hypothetical protein KL86PLE_100538 [uncultured Pleomorphomonas sp.]|uniref:Uncharacterized protein n=1 Tax=uncultured Pleomorphomonas sp. TaxID=442121 RepID=A0A212L420_9HYPH|nr:hypothetical protein KL86PLE_100538 [uncultured Pleomorphomonas sp.]